MTKKQQEIHRALPFLIGKEVSVWLTIEKRNNGKFHPDPFLEGTVDRSTGTYLILRNVILSNGKWFNDYDINIGSIGKITEKSKNVSVNTQA